MKFVFFTFGASLYGANRSMIDLILGLKGHGITSMVIYPEEGPLAGKLTELGISCKFVKFDNSVHWRSKYSSFHPRRWISTVANSARAIYKLSSNKARLREISKIVNDFEADLVITNTSVIDMGVLVSLREGIPHLWHIREFGNLDWDFFPDFGQGYRGWRMRQSKIIIFISQSIKNHYIKGLGRDFSCKLAIIHNGIASSKEMGNRSNWALQSSGRSQDVLTFSIIGHVKTSKGQFRAVDALKVVCDNGFAARLLVVGGGELERLKEYVSSRGLDSCVSVIGHLDDVNPIYQSTDVGLMCSESEGFGRVTAEFMSWGVPVIGRDSGATPELITHGTNGLLYDGTAEELASAMQRLIEDKKFRDNLAEKARLHALDHFSYEKCAENFLTTI